MENMDADTLLKQTAADLKKYEELMTSAQEKLQKADQLSRKVAVENQVMQIKIDQNGDVIDYYETLSEKLKAELHDTIFKQHNISLSAKYYSEKMNSLKTTYLITDRSDKTAVTEVSDDADDESDLQLQYVTLTAEVNALNEDISKNELKIGQLIGKLRGKQATSFPPK